MLRILLASGFLLVSILERAAWAQTCEAAACMGDRLSCNDPEGETCIAGSSIADPGVATDNQGNWVALFEVNVNENEAIGNEIGIATSTNNGESWSETRILTEDECEDGASGNGNPQVMTDGNGLWVAAWNERHTLLDASNPSSPIVLSVWADIVTRFSTDNGATWSARQELATGWATDSPYEMAVTNLAPRLAFDLNGEESVWIVTWVRLESPIYDSVMGVNPYRGDVMMSRGVYSGGEFEWSAASAPFAAPGRCNDFIDLAPGIAADGGGNWCVAWFSTRDELAITSSTSVSLGSDLDVLFSASSDGGLTWRSPHYLNQDAETDEDEWDFSWGSFALKVDSEGWWNAMWPHGDPESFTSSEIRIARCETEYLFNSGSSTPWSQSLVFPRNTPVLQGGDEGALLPEGESGRWLAFIPDLAGDIKENLVAVSTDHGSNWTPFALATAYKFHEGKTEAVGNFATDSNGRRIEGRGYDGLFGSKLLHNPEVLNSHAHEDSSDDEQASVDTDGNGRWISVWSSGENDVLDAGGDPVEKGGGIATFFSPSPPTTDRLGPIPRSLTIWPSRMIPPNTRP